jgi:hypothetical protein
MMMPVITDALAGGITAEDTGEGEAHTDVS